MAAASLPRLLRHAGLDVDTICRPGCPVRRSRYISRVHEVGGSEAAFFDAVRDILAQAPAPYLWVVPVTDTDVRGLARRASEAWVGPILPTSRDAAVVRALLDKPAMEQLLASAGVRQPRARRVSTPDELIAFGAEAAWPVMLKPVDGVGGGGVVRVDQPGQAVDAMQRAGAGHPDLMVQEYIPGPVASCQVVSARGVPLAWATSYKIRTWPGAFGPSSAVRFEPVQGIEEQVMRIVSALHFHGALSVDFIVDRRTGEPVIIEVNARPAGLMTRGHRAGVDFAAALRQMLFGTPPVTHTRGTRRVVTAGLYPQDLVRCAEERAWGSLRDWLRLNTLRDIPWGDPAVLAHHTKYLVSRLAGRA